MAEELQSLLERIQKDGVEKAEQRATEIVAEAKQKATATVKKAEARAVAIREEAEREAAAFAERGRRSVEQAARDIVLSVRQAVNKTFENLVAAEVADALDSDILKQVLVKAVESYCRETTAETPVELLIPAKQQKEVAKFLTAKYSRALRAGLDIKADRALGAGFRVSVVNDNVDHDFSDQAITAALCQFLRPHLAEIINPKAQEKPAGDGDASPGGA